LFKTIKFLKLCFKRIFAVTPEEVTSVSSYYVQEAVTVRLSLNFILGAKFIHFIEKTELVSGVTSVTILHSS
jgi:hypothetical protein